MFVSHQSCCHEERVMSGETSLFSWCRLLFWSLLGATAHPGGYPLLAPILLVLALGGLFHERQRGSPHLKTFIWGTTLGFGQLIWMATPTYVGTWCLVAAPMLGLAIGLQWMAWGRWGVWGSSPRALIQAGFLWALLEFSRETWLWSGLGFGALSTVLTALPTGILFANLFGHYGISWWIVTLGLLCWHHPRHLMTWCWSVLPFIYGALFTWVAQVHDSEPIRISAVQTGEHPAVPGSGPSLSERWLRLEHQLASIPASAPLSQSSHRPAHLIVLPESVLRLDLDQPLQEGPDPFTLDQYYADWARRSGATLIAGADWEDARGYRTGQALYAPDGTRLRAAKRRLLIGAEMVPYSWMKSLLQPFGYTESFVPADHPSEWPWEGGWLTPATCYESAFASDLREACTNRSSLIVVSINDGWYADSSLMEHHAAAAQLRAVELGRPILQASHNGITGLWTPFGNCNARLNSAGTEVLDLECSCPRVPTPWVLWGHWGWLTLGVVSSLALAWRSLRIQPRSSNWSAMGYWA
jgi:apolipoprotein N-acyltransferase